MRDPIDPAWVENRLLDMLDAAEALSDSMAPLAIAAADAEARYKLTYHKRMLLSEEKTVAMKESDATVTCSDAFHTWKIAEARVSACRDKARLLSEEIRAIQSLGASVRTALGERR